MHGIAGYNNGIMDWSFNIDTWAIIVQVYMQTYRRHILRQTGHVYSTKKIEILATKISMHARLIHS